MVRSARHVYSNVTVFCEQVAADDLRVVEGFGWGQATVRSTLRQLIF